MYHILEDHESYLEIEKSKFITYLHKATTEEEAKAFILRIKKLHPSATHHCQAFVLGKNGELTRSNDDGEPSGTAGVPMLECLKKNHVSDLVCVVVRYFGGIKLGAGGLIRAYSKSVSHALQEAILVEAKEVNHWNLCFDYSFIGKIDYLLSSKTLYHLEKDYDLQVSYTYYTNDDFLLELQELSNGTLTPTLLGSSILEIPMDTIIEEA